MAASFRGGIHPRSEKRARLYRLEPVQTPPRVVLHLAQHAGAAAEPVVKPGDQVLRCQQVAKPSGFISSAVHASVSGTVKAIEPWPHPATGERLPAIVIESDGANRTVEAGVPKYRDYYRHDRAAIIAVLQEAGVVGLGGAMFPTHVKLGPPAGKEVDVLLVNGCECEPFLTCDDKLMQEDTAAIFDGIRIAMHVLDAGRAVVAVEENKPEAIDRMRAGAAKVANVEVRPVPVRYPQGAEKQLIAQVLGREVPSGGLPIDVGVVVHNVATLAAVSRAIMHGIPLTERAVTITGDIQRHGNFIVPMGTVLSDLVKILNIDTAAIRRVVFGGPMMGVAQGTWDVPTVKGTSGIVLLRAEEPVPSGPCVRCGKCVMVCPMGLMPNFLSVYAERERWDDAARFRPLDCIECGCCAYVCVSRRPIVAQVRRAKAILRARKTKTT
jgi:electron transport complex protein RnfC